VDRDTLTLRQIIDAGEAILEFTTGGRDEFMGDRRTRDAVVRNLEIIGEAVKRLSPAVRDAHPDVRWRDIAGLRDFAIHRYDWVDFNEIWRIVDNDLRPLLESVRRIAKEGAGRKGE
jgi:uncharacterized protein with HEPN domain